MREIELYRGKTTKKPEGHELNEIWVEGDLVSAMGKYYIHPRSNGFDTVGEIAKLVCLHEVQPETIGQYTGLTDKNGEMIFEGDVVSIPIFGYNSGKRMLLEVRWHEAWLKWVVTNEKDTPGYFFEDLSEYDYNEMEVTGNIHDSRELLGGADNGNG